MATSS